MASQRMQAEDLSGALSWGERAIALATEIEDVRTLVTALASVGGAKLKAGAGGWEELERSRALAEEAGLEAEAARAHVNLYAAAEAYRRYDEIDASFEAAAAYCIEHDLEPWLVFLRAVRSITLLHRGRWEEAADLAAMVVAGPASEDTVWIALAVLAALRSRRGDSDAPQALDRALRAAEPLGGMTAVGWVRAIRAEAAWLAGDPERARAEALAGWDMVEPDSHGWGAGELAVWLWRTGDIPAQPAGLTFAEPYRRSIRGDPEAASVAWTQLGCSFDAALALCDSSDEEALRRAVGSFSALGAGAAVTMARRAMRAAGARVVAVGPRSRTRSNPFGLTGRELEVLELVAEGMEDREIAERLVLSPRTVSHHVSSVLSKLGASGRKQAVRTYLAAMDRQSESGSSP
jgi:DNA-binding CsgD family transcriptional regulator